MFDFTIFSEVVELKKLLLIVLLAFILGCVQGKDFKYGLKQINNINSKYNTSMETYPHTIKQIDLMISDFEMIKKLQLEAGKEPLNYVIDYRLLNLEAERLYIESQKYGNSGTTKYGFGCKLRPLIIESLKLRNSSALKAFEAVDLLREFIGKYPKESASSGFSEKNALFLNASFYQISRDARSDSNIINNFCPQNVTLEIYRQNFRKPSFVEKYNFSEEYISNLGYEEAVKIYKNDMGAK